MSETSDRVKSPNLAAARKHIEMLTGNAATPIHIACVHDKSRVTYRHEPATSVVDAQRAIEKAQEGGNGVFIVANEGGHKDADITRIRSCFADFDDGRSPDDIKWHLEPTFIVYTSRGFHAYWRVDGAVEVKGFRQLQRRLAARYGSDSAVINPARIMRLAGSLHLKDPSKPTLVTIEERSGLSYDGWEVEAGLPELLTLAERAPSEARGEPVPADHLERLLSHIDPGLPRPDWIKVIAGVRASNVPGDDDESVRAGWVLRHARGDILKPDGTRWYEGTPPNYTGDDDVIRVFETMPPKEGGVGYGTVYHHARAGGYTGPSARPPGPTLGEAFESVIASAGEDAADAPPVDDVVTLDEDGIIRAFTQLHGAELAFDHHIGQWFRFNGNYWRREETKLAHDYARTVSTTLAGDDKRAKALKRVGTWEAIERGARFDRAFAVTSERWNRDKMLLGTPDGTVDLRTGELRAGRAEDYISRITAVAPIPLERFKPEFHCPRWMAFLDTALAGDKEAIRFLQQWGGYLLTGDCKEQCFVFVYGPGGSGKSTAFNTIGEILGDYAKNAASETFTASKHERHPEELARLHGARFVRASETAQGRVWDENRIKSMTGQDTITARFMRANSFEFVPEFKIVIFGNNAPVLRNPDTAMRRRMIVLPFDHPPKVKDANLPMHLKAEWPGILSWLILGCLDLQTYGLIRPTVAITATESYFDQQDTFGRFLADHCDLGQDYTATNKELWGRWETFARTAGEHPGSLDRGFPERLKQRGLEAIKDKHGIRGRGWKGVRLRAVEDW